VAFLASIHPRRSRELAFVHIRMTVNTCRESNLESRLRAGRDMALLAGDSVVRFDQWEVRARVIRDRECRRLPPCNGVTGFAFAVIGAGCKLAAVRIGFVAISA
jgi:hypothetical protein